ncbi:MAG: hypothetical protein NTY98_00735 [Verrucomicrobia bacterium]|nr:hypothetical protein [Verrucomicrobiota bacterium]
MPAPKKTDGRRDLDGDGDIDLADDPSRDLDHDGRIESDDREELDIDADNDIDATDRTLAAKQSVGAALGMAKAGQSKQQGHATACNKVR